MGFSPIFVSIPFSPFWDKDRRWGRELHFTANSCWIYSERDWRQQLSLSQSNVRTTGASFVLWEEPCEGRLEVSLGLKGQETYGGGFSSFAPSSLHPGRQKRFLELCGFRCRSQATPWVPSLP